MVVGGVWAETPGGWVGGFVAVGAWQWARGGGSVGWGKRVGKCGLCAEVSGYGWAGGEL